MKEIETTSNSTTNSWLPKLSRLLGMNAHDFENFRIKYSADFRYPLSDRDTIWQILSNLDSGTLNQIERVHVYTSIALFLEQEGRDPKSALERVKHLIFSNGGSTILFGGDRFHVYPIDDLPVGGTLPIIAIGEVLQGFPLRRRAVTFALESQSDAHKVDSFSARTNQCGVMSAFWKLSEHIFPSPIKLILFMACQDLGYDRKFVAEFELLS